MTLDSTDPPHSPTFSVCPPTISFYPLFGLFLLSYSPSSVHPFLFAFLFLPFCSFISLLQTFIHLLFLRSHFTLPCYVPSFTPSHFHLPLSTYSPSTFTCSHSDVTKVLTYLAQASHDLVPPEVSCSRRYQFQHRFIVCISLHCRTGLIA